MPGEGAPANNRSGRPDPATCKTPRQGTECFSAQPSAAAAISEGDDRRPDLAMASIILNALPRDTGTAVEPGYASHIPWYYRRFLSRKSLKHIPIGSNIPQVSLSLEEQQIIRASYGCTTARLVVYFGFAHKAKGIESVFRRGAGKDRLLLICDLNPADSYQREILALMAGEHWSGMAQATGHLQLQRWRACWQPPMPSCSAQAGVSTRNGSFLAARAQGAFVITTHSERRGFHAAEISLCCTRQ